MTLAASTQKCVISDPDNSTDLFQEKRQPPVTAFMESTTYRQGAVVGS